MHFLKKIADLASRFRWKTSIGTIASWLVVSFFSIVAYFRIFLGTDLTDEAQYVVSSLLSSIGARPFHHELFIQQSASLLFEPIIWAYHSLFGSTGILLMVRHLYFALTIFAFYRFMRLFQIFLPKDVAALAGLPILLFTPYAIPSLSYNTIGFLCFGIASSYFLGWLHNISLQSQKLLYRGVAFCGACLVAYPTLLAPWLAFFCSCYYFYPESRTEFRKGALLLGILLSAFAVYILLRFPLQDLVESYQYTKLFGIFGSISEKAGNAFRNLKNFSPPAFYIIVIILACLEIQYWKKGYWMVLLPLLCLAYLVTVGNTVPPITHIATTVIFWLGIPFSYFSLSLKERSHKGLVGLILALFLGSLITSWSSSNGIFAGVLMSILGFSIVLGISFMSKPRWACMLSAGLIGLCLSVWSYTYFYNDLLLPDLDTWISQGPYAGLKTSYERAKFLDHFHRDLEASSAKAKSVLFFDSFPAGYMFSDLKPASRAVYMHAGEASHPVRKFYAEYYSQSENLPDLFFRFLTLPTTPNVRQISPIGNARDIDPFYDQLPKTGLYSKLVENIYYEVWKRKEL